MRHSQRYDCQGHPRSGSRWGDDLSPLSGLFFILFYMRTVQTALIIMSQSPWCTRHWQCLLQWSSDLVEWTTWPRQNSKSSRGQRSSSGQMIVPSLSQLFDDCVLDLLIIHWLAVNECRAWSTAARTHWVLSCFWWFLEVRYNDSMIKRKLQNVTTESKKSQHPGWSRFKSATFNK